MIDHEQALIGAAVMGAFVDVAPVVDQQDFAHQSHRTIWARCVDLADAGEPIDAITVGDGLSPELAGYVTGLCADTYSTRNAAAYARTVAAHALNRRIDAIAARIPEIEGEPAKRLADLQAMVLALNEKAEADEGVDMTSALREFFDDLAERYEMDGDYGVQTGFPDVDARILGMGPGDLVVLGGRPSHGKTAFALQAVLNNPELPALIFSMEMTRNQLIGRMVANVGRVPASGIRQPKQFLGDEHWPRLSAATTALKRPIRIVDRPALHVRQIASIARRHALRSGLGLIVVDYMQLARGDGGNREQEIADVSRGLKGLGMELGVPVLALSQLNRDIEKRPINKRRPVMADLRESGSIEQDADAVLFIYREEVYMPDSPSAGTAEIIIDKSRHGSQGSARLSFSGEHLRFESYTGRPIEEAVRGSTGFDYD